MLQALQLVLSSGATAERRKNVTFSWFWTNNLVGGFKHLFIFPSTWGNDPNGIICFKRVETTNMKSSLKYGKKPLKIAIILFFIITKDLECFPCSNPHIAKVVSLSGFQSFSGPFFSYLLRRYLKHLNAGLMTLVLGRQQLHVHSLGKLRCRITLANL